MLLKRIVRFIPFRPSELFRIMMPPALLLSVCSRGLEAAEKTYQPTQAQRRLAEQQRLQNQRIAEIRRRNAERNAAKTAAAQAAEKAARQEEEKLAAEVDRQCGEYAKNVDAAVKIVLESL